MVLGAAYASSYKGTYDTRTAKPIFNNVHDNSVHGLIEDPFVWKEESGFYMIAKDMTGRFCEEKYAHILASSNIVMEWELHKGLKAYSRSILWDEGILRTMGFFERPFILSEENKPRCIFAATSDGNDGSVRALNTWNMAIPFKNPRATEPLR